VAVDAMHGTSKPHLRINGFVLADCSPRLDHREFRDVATAVDGSKRRTAGGTGHCGKARRDALNRASCSEEAPDRGWAADIDYGTAA
jgi:hypothetical protein